jgi:hypothetical protein
MLASAICQEAGMSTFAHSAFVPVVLGFFGLGTGYLIYGPAELFHYPRRGDPGIDRSMGIWGIFLPGLCQVVTGIILFVGLTWFQVFTDKPLYMAAVAFTAYGIHWFAIGWNRYQGNDPRPQAGMSIAFLIISVLGAFVFFHTKAWPVGVLFVGLALVYIGEFFVSVKRPFGDPLLGLAHLATGVWLMYLTVATTLNIALGYKLPGG